MWYEINVSWNGRHYFATSDRSITDRVKLEPMVKEFRKRFPTEEGFKIDASCWEKTGRAIVVPL